MEEQHYRIKNSFSEIIPKLVAANLVRPATDLVVLITNDNAGEILAYFKLSRFYFKDAQTQIRGLEFALRDTEYSVRLYRFSISAVTPAGEWVQES